MEENVPPGRYVYCSDCNDHQAMLTTPEGRSLDVYVHPGQPPIVIDPEGKINGGRPTSVFDLLYEQTTGKKLSRGQHAMPKQDGDYANFDPADAQVMTAAAIHKFVLAAPGRGRKPAIKLDVVKVVKDTYYKGKATLKQMAEAAGVSERTLSSIVRGRAYWYA